MKKEQLERAIDVSYDIKRLKDLKAIIKDGKEIYISKETFTTGIKVPVTAINKDLIFDLIDNKVKELEEEFKKI